MIFSKNRSKTAAFKKKVSVVLFLDILPNDDETNEQRNRSTGTGSGAIARYVRAQKSTSEEGSSRTNAFSQGLGLPKIIRVFSKKKVSVVLV